MGTVTAKFRVDTVTAYQPQSECTPRTVKLVAIKTDPKDNTDWSKWTPSGSMEMHITNDAAADQFVPGKIASITIEFDE